MESCQAKILLQRPHDNLRPLPPRHQQVSSGEYRLPPRLTVAKGPISTGGVSEQAEQGTATFSSLVLVETPRGIWICVTNRQEHGIPQYCYGGVREAWQRQNSRHDHVTPLHLSSQRRPRVETHGGFATPPQQRDTSRSRAEGRNSHSCSVIKRKQCRLSENLNFYCPLTFSHPSRSEETSQTRTVK